MSAAQTPSSVILLYPWLVCLCLPKLAVDGNPSYSQHTPANARVRGLGAIFTAFRLDQPCRIPEKVRGRPGGPTLPRGRRTRSQCDGPLVSARRNSRASKRRRRLDGFENVGETQRHHDSHREEHNQRQAELLLRIFRLLLALETIRRIRRAMPSSPPPTRTACVGCLATRVPLDQPTRLAARPRTAAGTMAVRLHRPPSLHRPAHHGQPRIRPARFPVANPAIRAIITA